jgi:hypothetical protein
MHTSNILTHTRRRLTECIRITTFHSLHGACFFFGGMTTTFQTTGGGHFALGARDCVQTIDAVLLIKPWTPPLPPPFRTPLKDWWDTYLPQYERVFTEANAAGAMCSYEARCSIFFVAGLRLLEDAIGIHTCCCWGLTPNTYVCSNSMYFGCSLLTIVIMDSAGILKAINGMPSCANSWLLNDVLRKKWDRQDAFISTDCGI